MTTRSSIVLVQLFVCACALPEVGASDAGAASGMHVARTHKPSAPVQALTASGAAAPATADPPDADAAVQMPVRAAGGRPAMAPVMAPVMPSAQNCPIERALQEVTQTIWVVVDGSGSMLEPLDEKSRWLALREALLDNAAGVVRALEQVQWGLALYDGPLPGGGGTLPDGGVHMPSAGAATTCPRLITVAPKADNFATMNAIYPVDPPGGSTPTHLALNVLTAQILAARPPAMDHRTTVVLATDGAPNDFCSMASLPPDLRPEVIAAVQNFAQAGIKTYVISLAGEDQQLSEHLAQVAQAGGTGRPAFVPTSRAELIDTLRQIATVKPSCDVTLARAVDPLRACDGVVEYAGQALTCNAADGFSLRDQSHLRLTGTACAAYQASPDTLKVSYPCDAVR